MSTVIHTELYNLWEGRVIVDEIKQFKDDRGSLVELWRTDDDKGNISRTPAVSPQMSYWSVTNPYITRGPHEHLYQCDFFITWLSRMVYELYNPVTREMFHFITDPNKVFRVKVDHGILHAYRNIENRPVLTGNFPTSLFMGYEKKEPIDEIRHEHLIEQDSETYVIVGANGRLGKAVINELYKKMGYYTYKVFPIFDKFHNENDVSSIFDSIFKSGINPKKTKVINCSGLTNVQSLKKYTEEVELVNVSIPKFIQNSSYKHGFKFYQISSDYVFRDNDESAYTKSKKRLESILDYRTKIIRVANLFSMDLLDTRNIVNKIKEKIINNDVISYDPNILIFPSEANKVATVIVDFLKDDIKDTTELNIYGNPISLSELCELFNYKNTQQVNSSVIQNKDKFLKENSYKVDCTEKIIEKFNSM